VFPRLLFPRLLIVAVLALLAWALVPRVSSGAGHERAYVVRPADTLWSIAAAHYGGDPREAVWRIERRNRLTSTTLVPGQPLVLP
jgi:nucleoid-associated protein YgaU